MTRRKPHPGAVFTAALVLGAAGCSSGAEQDTGDSAARPGTPHVELIYLDHPPVADALEEVDQVLAEYEGRVTVDRIDAESDEGLDLARAHDLGGHVALALLIDGSSEVEAGGEMIDFNGFPDGASPIPSAQGTWTVADLEIALEERVAGR